MDFFLKLDLIVNQVFDPIVREHVFGRAADGRFGLGTAAASLVETFQSLEGGGDAVLTVLRVVEALFRRAIPVNAKALVHLVESHRQIEDFLAVVFAAGAPAPQGLPAHLAIGRLQGEGVGLRAPARQNGQETCSLLIQAQERVFDAQFTVRHVKKIRAAQQTTQALPGFPMGAVIALVAGVGFKMDRHRSIGADRQRVDELF